jgi:hypothetical protein
VGGEDVHRGPVRLGTLLPKAHLALRRQGRPAGGMGVPTHCISRDAGRASSKLTRASNRMSVLTPEPFASLLIDIASRVR